MNAPDPAVSIIMTVFNTRAYVREAVESLLAQSWRDFELILIDDGSTDDSRAVLEDLARRDGRIRLVSGPNRGIVGSSNLGLSMARGQFVARMDSDDVSLPQRLERQVGFLNANPQVVAVSAWYTYMDACGRHLTTIRMPVENAGIQDSCLSGVPAMCHGAVTIRRKALEGVGGYDTAFAEATEDLDLFLRLGEVGKLANIPEALLRVRLHSRSIGERARDAQLRMARRACEAAWRRRGIQGQFLPGEPWRPGRDRASRLAFALRCGWWAFKSSQRKTAAIYGCKAVWHCPWASSAWRLLACSLVKPLG